MRMFFKLLILFTVVPLLELALLIKVGTYIGTINTLGIVIVTAIVGAALVRYEGIGVISRMQQNLGNAIFPADELLEGAMILVAGALFLTPGFLTDITALLLVFPPTRTPLRKLIKKWIDRRYFNTIDA